MSSEQYQFSHLAMIARTLEVIFAISILLLPIALCIRISCIVNIIIIKEKVGVYDPYAIPFYPFSQMHSQNTYENFENLQYLTKMSHPVAVPYLISSVY